MWKTRPNSRRQSIASVTLAITLTKRGRRQSIASVSLAITRAAV